MLYAAFQSGAPSPARNEIRVLVIHISLKFVRREEI